MDKKLKNDQFELLRKIHNSPEFSQRDLASELGFSLGKLNYCLKELKKKGLVKIKNFQRKKNKLTHLKYILTPKGMAMRTALTLNFMRRKLKEYDQLKKELNNNVDNIKI